MSEVIRSDNSGSDDSMDTDRDFTPTVEMMIHEFDDEATLDEEEEIEPADSQLLELEDLERERDMPLEELLSMYGYSMNDCAPDATSSTEADSSVSGGKAEAIAGNSNSDSSESSVPTKTRSKLKYLRENHVSESNSDNDDDDDYLFTIEDEEKSVRIGEEYQASVPLGLCGYDDALPYENEDKLLWDPRKLPEEETQKYLMKVAELKCLTKKVECKKHEAQKLNNVFRARKRARFDDDEVVVPIVRDDEQALYLLLQCGFNVEEALRRRRLNVIPQTNMSLWSEDECIHFESGIADFGKNFHQIQLHKVRTRSVEELVQFYYYWKKSERHDIFIANNIRLEKKNYNMHPGITDFMEKCNDEPEIEEQPDSNGDSNDSNSNCNNGEYLFNSAPGASRALRQLIDDDLRSGTSVNLLKEHAHSTTTRSCVLKQ